MTKEEIQIYIDIAWKKKNNYIDWLLIESLIHETFYLVKIFSISESEALKLIEEILASHTGRR